MKKRTASTRAKKTATVKAKRAKDLDVKKKVTGGASVKFAP